MFSKCTQCFRGIKRRLRGHTIPKWHTHLQGYCRSRAQKEPWCQMFLDNIDLITDQNLPKETEHLVRNTNIASEIVKIITNHFEQEGNLFRFCIELFGSYLKLKYSEIISPSRNSLNRIASQYKDFQQLLIDLFVLYYNLEDRQIIGEQIFYKSTLPSLASHFAFQNEDIHSTITRTAKLSLKSQIDKLQFQFQKYSHHPISQFLIGEDFQLNERTLALHKSSSHKMDQRVYSGTIQMINQIIRVRSPAQKRKLIEGLPKQIQSFIRQFYSKYSIEEEIRDLDGKDLRSIMSYVIIQANQPVFLAHLEIASIFSILEGKSTKIYEVLSTACEDIQNGLIAKKQCEPLTTEISENTRKNSDGLNFFDEVSNTNLDL